MWASFCLEILLFCNSYTSLQSLLLAEELANVPFLVLGNKIDLGSAPSEEDLRYQLGLYETYGKEVKLNVFFICWMNLTLFFSYNRRKETKHTPFVLSNFICAQLLGKWATATVRGITLTLFSSFIHNFYLQDSSGFLSFCEDLRQLGNEVSFHDRTLFVSVCCCCFWYM